MKTRKMGKITGFTDRRGSDICIGDTVKYPWLGTRCKFTIQVIDGQLFAVPADSTGTWSFLVDEVETKFMTVVRGK